MFGQTIFWRTLILMLDLLWTISLHFAQHSSCCKDLLDIVYYYYGWWMHFYLYSSGDICLNSWT
jgi:hypothetical protein